MSAKKKTAKKVSAKKTVKKTVKKKTTARKVAKKSTAKKVAAKKTARKTTAKKVAKKASVPKKRNSKKATDTMIAPIIPSYQQLQEAAYYHYLHRVVNSLPGNPWTDWNAALQQFGIDN